MRIYLNRKKKAGMKNHKYFRDKVIWITGASSGIGEALAKALSAWDVKLILSSRRTDELERVKASLPMKKENIFILPLDLSQPGTLEGKAKEALGAFGHIDILVNNGGVSQRALALETSVETDRMIMEINYFSGLILTKAVLPSMISHGGGQIVAVSSVTGKFGFPLRSAYAASKHAMYGFYETIMAEYWDNGIRTTMVCPGRISTNISMGAIGPDGKPQNIMDHGQKYGTPVEVCAKDIINGIRRQKPDVYTGGKEVLNVYFKRFIPALSYLMARKAQRV
jgi:dehydrogenase/reductase SDR family member 7B